jgi:hypothetical protein
MVCRVQESAEVRVAIMRFCDAFGAGDMAAFDAAIAAEPKAFVIGTQRATNGRGEWIGNYRALVEQRLVGEGGAGLRVEPSGIRGYAEGSFGWAAGWITFVLPGDVRLPSRFTGVLRREGDDWKLLNTHFSVAVPDEVAVEHAHAWLAELGQGPPPV